MMMMNTRKNSMTLNRSNSNVDEADNEERLMNFSLHRAVALFLDGMSRAALLPFGPSLVYRLSHGSSIKLGLDCAKIVYRLTVVVVAYLIGRGFGGSIARKFTISDDSLPKVVARLAGAAISLHVFTFGAGLKSVWWLVIIRFISAALVGTMCVLTKEPLPVGMVDGQNQLSSTSTSTSTQLEMTTTTTEERMEGGKMVDAELQGKRRRHGYVDFASGTAKIYMTAFAVSILSGGLFYRHATGDATFQALTGSRQFTLSPLFMLVVALISEFVLRCVFAFVEKNQGEKTHEGPMRKRSSGSFSRPYNAHRRSLTLPSATIQEDIEEGLLREPPQIRSSISSSVPLELPERRDSDLFAPCRERLDSSNHSVPFSSPRRRTETTDSEFFDCNSVLSDMEEVQFFDEELGGDHPPAAESEEQPTRVIIRGMEGDGEEHKVAKYVNGKCLYGDDKPAHVPNGNSPGEVPENYLKLCSGKQHKAEAMWRETQEWRRKHNVWKIHTVPHRWFPKIKKAYPHFVHGFSKQGYPIIYEQPGKMNLKELFREGCAVSDMVRHYIFFLEFISNHICTREEVRARMGPLTPKNHNASSWGTMVVMDVKGTGLSHLSGDVLMYLKSAGDINNSHYPFSMKRAFIVNSPFWLAGAWSSIKGILPDSVQVDILSSHKYPTALREYIDDDQIPREYGGSSPYPLGQHPFELEMNKLVEEANKGSEDDDDDYDDEDVNDEPVVESTSEPTYTFDYNKNSWSTEIDGVKVSDGAPHMAGAKWTTTLTTSSSRSGQQALRRRAASTERLDPSTTGLIPFDNDLMNDDDNDDKKGNSYGGEGDIFAIVSVMYLVWCGIQGVIETAIPLWMLIPPELGGLGYAPSRSGVAMFCATMVLLWVMRTKVSKVIAKIPSKAPMRSFRIGVGAESVLLLLLATVPKTARPEKRTDAVLVMAITIIIMSCIVLSSLLGRASSTILHRIASTSLASSKRMSSRRIDNNFGLLSILYRHQNDTLLSDCRSGKFTNKLNYIAEIFGVLAVAPICSWSLAHERPTPFDGTCCLFLSSLLTMVLYVCSFSLHLNLVGEFAPHPRDHTSSTIPFGTGNNNTSTSTSTNNIDDVQSTRKCGSFLCEVVTVSVSDMASLFDEANWSITPLLGQQGQQQQQHQQHSNAIKRRSWSELSQQ